VASPHGWHAICEPSQRQSAAAALCVPRTDGRGGRARRVLGEGSRGARVKLARIDGARGMGGRIEYNVPRDPRGGMQLVNYGFALNDLLAGEELTAPVQALRCDGHQHMGAPAAPSIRSPPSFRAACAEPRSRLRVGRAAERRAVRPRSSSRRTRAPGLRACCGLGRRGWVQHEHVTTRVPVCWQQTPSKERSAVPRPLRSQDAHGAAGCAARPAQPLRGARHSRPQPHGLGTWGRHMA